VRRPPSGTALASSPALLPLLLAALLSLAAAAPARAGSLDEDIQVWAPVITQVDIVPETLRGWIELQPRFTDDAGRLGVMIWRPGLGFYATPWLSLWGGYAFVERFSPDYSAEHRIWEQAQVAGPIVADIGLKGLLRLRFEQRMREGDDPVAHRVRLLARGQVALGRVAPPSLHAIVWDEIFFGLNDVDWGPQAGFDRNRTFAGLGFQVVPQVRIEAGYLLEFVPSPTPKEDVGNHVLSISVWIDL